MLTVAVSDVDAAKIVFAAEYAKMWLSKEPLDATDERQPRIMSGVRSTSEPLRPDHTERGL